MVGCIIALNSLSLNLLIVEADSARIGDGREEIGKELNLSSLISHLFLKQIYNEVINIDIPWPLHGVALDPSFTNAYHMIHNFPDFGLSLAFMFK